MRLLKFFQKLFAGCSNNIELIKGQSVPLDHALLRRAFFQDKKYVKPDGSLSSRAFTPRPLKDDGKLSVDIEKYILSFESAILDSSRFRLYRINTSDLPPLDLECIYDPIAGSDQMPPNPAHAVIIGFEEDDESKAAILAKCAKRVNYPN